MAQRDKLTKVLTERGIGWAVYYPIPLHLQPVYENLGYQIGALPIVEAAAREVVSLPVFPELTPDERQTVAEAVRSGCNSAV